MQDASRLMAGVFVATGHHELGLTALEKVIACHELKHQKELELIWKRDEEEEKLWQKMLVVHQKEEVCWTVGDVCMMVSWFKRPGDSKIPSTKELLKHWYEQTKNRSENNRTYLKAGEDPIIDANANANNEPNGGSKEWELCKLSCFCFGKIGGVHAFVRVLIFCGVFFVPRNTT